MIRRIAPQFFTTDLATTLAYYQSVLGFACRGTWGAPPVYAIVTRDGQAVHFRVAAPPTPNPDKIGEELLDAYVFVDDVDALHAEFAARGAVFTRPLGDTPWGMREFVLRDIDGRLLAFGADLPAARE